MKKTIFTVIFLLCVVVPFDVFATEQILSYDVRIDMRPDATLAVQEKIIYDFGDHQRHGIFRMIPIVYDTHYGSRRRITISHLSVKDAHGVVQKNTMHRKGRMVEIRIGDVDRRISGQHTYSISYVVSGAVNFFDSHDELYWNAIGTMWNVPIANAHVSVTVPDQVDSSEIQAQCFHGVFGSTQSCDALDVAQHRVSARVAHLPPHTGMTIVVGIPPGHMTPPSIYQRLWSFIYNNPFYIFPFVLAVALGYRWHRHRRNKKRRGTIVPGWEIPDDLSPAEIGLIYDERAQKKDISSLFIDLAIRGYLRIEPLDAQGLFGKKDYRIIKQRDMEHARPFEKEFFDALFKTGNRVKLSALKNTFYKDFERITQTLYKSMVSAGYFARNPQRFRIMYIFYGGLVFLAALPIGLTLYDVYGVSALLSGILCGVMLIVFGQIMSQRIPKGDQAYERIMGLKRYLSLAEKRRIDFHNAPEKNPKTFEKYLPYAMVLGVEEKWAEQFVDIYKNEQPSWYAGTAPVNAAALTNEMSSFATYAQASATARPSSASSGRSGFSGGGTGGGFGGGGGGSW